MEPSPHATTNFPLSLKISQIRTWTYICNHHEWLNNPIYWQEKTKKIEPKQIKEKVVTAEISAPTENKNLEVPKQESKKSAQEWGRATNDPRNKG